MDSSTSDFIRTLSASITSLKPVAPRVVSDALDRLPFTGDHLQEIYYIATQGAVNQFSRGFHDEALQYIAIAAKAKKGIIKQQ